MGMKKDLVDKKEDTEQRVANRYLALLFCWDDLV